MGKTKEKKSETPLPRISLLQLTLLISVPSSEEVERLCETYLCLQKAITRTKN